jgi:hypothetical protein
MSRLATEVEEVALTARRSRLQEAAVAISAAIALLYAATFAGVLTIEGAGDGDPAVLGVAAVLFAVLGVLLWWRRSRVLWAAAAAIQVLMGAMYLAIAAERDPSFEVWGLTIRGLSLVLLACLVGLFVEAGRARRAAP